MKRTTMFLAGAVIAALPAVSFAQAKELTASQSIRIKGSPEEVWAVVADFGNLADWLPPIAESKLVLKSRAEEGAIRALVRRNGTKVTEKLVEFDPYNMRLTYTYVDGAVAASDYFATMQVKDVGGGETEVVWSSRFTRLAYWQDPAPAGQDDATLSTFYNNVYKSGLGALKTAIESR